VRDASATPRRAEIALDPGDLNNLDLIDDEELVVTLSATGYVKAVTADAFRAQARGGRGVAGAKLRDDDYVTHVVGTTAHAYLLFFSTRGRVYRLRAHEIPIKERTARGTAIVNLLPLGPDERVQAVHRHPRLRDRTGTCSSPPSSGRSRRPASPSTTRRCGPVSSPSTSATTTSSSASSR
jgi:DNA gyrase subunit A